MSGSRRLLSILVVSSLTAISGLAQPRLVSAVSGASGQSDGDNFVLEDVRNRFTFPRDKSLLVYFTWDAEPGEYTLTAVWKDPEGKIAFISSDVKMRIAQRTLRAYWEYYLDESMPAGNWQVEVRANGQPAGAHAFELVIPKEVRAATMSAASAPPSMDELYRLRNSLVFVRRYDVDGRLEDTASGFIPREGRILTAFQAVDGASHLVLEYADGRTERVDSLLAWNWEHGWALLSAATAGHPPLEVSNRVPAIGDRLIVFSVEGENTRVIGGIDLTGRQQDRQAGELLHLNPNLPFAAVGGPLLDSHGKIVGLMIGNLLHGTRGPLTAMGMSPEFYRRLNTFNKALPIAAIPAEADLRPTPLATLVESGVFTAPLRPNQNFIAAGTAKQAPAEDGVLRASEEVSRFSRQDPKVLVMSLWALREKQKRIEGMISAKVYDLANTVRVQAPPVKLKIHKRLPVRHTFSFAPIALPGGIYRADLLWDDKVVWRTFIEISE